MMRWMMLGLATACAPKTSPVPAAAPPATEADAPAAPRVGPYGAPLDDGLPRVERDLLVWRLSREGVSSHLMGTCHAPIPLRDLLPDPMPLDEARVVVVEIDLDGLDPVEAAKLLWEDEAQVDRLGRARFAKVTRSLGGAMPAPFVNHLTDWAAVTSLSVGAVTPATAPPAPSAEGPPAPPPVAVDQAVTARAKERGIPIQTVETLAQQAALLDGLGFDLSKVIDATAEDLERGRAVTEAMARLCLRGDLGATPMLASSYDPVNEQMLEARNEAWYPRLADELAQGGAFVAVGAGHLLGPTGLLARFEADGYVVERLSGEVGEHPLADTSSIRAPDDTLLDDAVIDPFLDAVVPSLCAEDQVMRQCVFDDAPTCEARVRSDLTLCIDQVASTPEQFQGFASPAGAQALVGCGLSGALMEGMTHDTLGDAPPCRAFLDAARGQTP